MTYGEQHGTTTYTTPAGERRTVERGTREFFDCVDRVFYDWNRPLHSCCGYFSRIFPYERFRDRRVLEIGCGMGTMAMNWAQHRARVTAVDLNPVAVQQTAQRFDVYGLDGVTLQADANALPFGDGSFDYVYSWGVLHHSPNLEASFQEIFRVLRPKCEFGVMLYNRRSLLYAYYTLYIEALLHGEGRFLDSLELASRYADGAEQEGNPHTWPITAGEVRTICSPHCSALRVKTLGTELDHLLPQVIPLPKVDRFLPRVFRKAWARRWGWSLWISGERR